MPVQRTDLTDKTIEQWRAMRVPNVGASEVPALFSAHPYISPLRLYIEKQGLVDLPEPNSDLMRRGRLFEGPVGVAVAEERPHWRIVKAHEYLCDPELRLGCTPDFYVEGDPRGLGIVQAKTVAPGLFDREWAEGRCPFWVVLQLVTEMMLTDAAFGAVAGLKIDAYDVAVSIVDIGRHPGTEQRIRDAVEKFWRDMAAGIQPDMDYSRDRELIAALSPREATDTKVDLSTDNEVMSGLVERADIMLRMKADDARRKAIEAMVMARMQDAAVAIVPGFAVTWRTSHFKSYTVKERDVRVLRIFDKRPGQDDEDAG